VDFELLFEREFESAYAYLARRVGADLARDLAAETFTRADAGRRRFGPRRGERGSPWESDQEESADRARLEG
jgi:DNA-directed RNA polymerase specialized sigma24 family protein